MPHPYCHSMISILHLQYLSHENVPILRQNHILEKHGECFKIIICIKVWLKLYERYKGSTDEEYLNQSMRAKKTYKEVRIPWPRAPKTARDTFEK